MPDESKQIHVIGIDTSSIESFFEAKKKSIFKAERIFGPKRILDSFKTWLKDKNIKNHGLPIYSFMPSVGISSVAQCPNNYLTYYAPFRCLTVASMRAGAIFFVVFDGSKVLFTERLDIGSRLRKIFVVDNQITAITDFEGVIVGELSELTEKYIP